MRILLLAAGVAGIALTAPAFAGLEDQGRGKGQEERGGGGEDRGRGRGGGDEGRGRGGGERGERAAERAGEPAPRQEERARDRAERRFEREGRPIERAERPEENRFERDERRAERAERRIERRAVRVEDAAGVARLSWEPNRGVGRGCPPGLARKNNGCLPPGQARQLADQQNWYRGWWSYPDATNYVYQDGYLVRAGQQGIESYIPLLGGALWSGNAWPEQFQAEPVPDYLIDYYGLQEPYDYRYADGVIYGVDPNTQLIQQVAALVAGEEWAIGRQMPDGYDIYNVPVDYRDTYQDTPDAMYRYSDGYLYQVDPTTRLVQAIVQLIT